MLAFLLDLFNSFFKIGLFGFGGGYSMISLIQRELEVHGWLSMEEFIDVIAISQMTPGPIAINSGTFVGYQISTVFGSLTATIAVVLPSFILVLLLAHFFNNVKDSDYVQNLLKYLRPTVIGLIIAASFSIAKTSVVDLSSILIVLMVIFLMGKTRIHPILIIVLSGLSGVLIYG
ncbi:MAG: chromate transporter [Halanaerobiales bacterium]